MASLFKYTFSHPAILPDSVFMTACAVFIAGLVGSVQAADINAARKQFKTGQYIQCLQAAQKAIEDGTYRSKRQWWILIVEAQMALGRYD